MKFTWSDYSSEYTDLVESWLDSEAARELGLDEGWHAYFDFCIHDEHYRLGDNFWCKVISDGDAPFAVITLFMMDGGTLCVPEYIVAPDMRNKGYGSAALVEVLTCSDKIIGTSFKSATAAIFPDNIASQKSFEKTGFRFERAHPDGDIWYYVYEKEENPMKFTWSDYSSEYTDLVESWLDSEATRESGLDEGWRDYYDCCVNDGDYRLGENFWCKVISDGDAPFAAIALGLWDGTLTVSEYVVAPDMRNKGYGQAALAEILASPETIIGKSFASAKAVIFPDNIASQKAFEKAGFRFESAHPDGDAWYYVYNKEPEDRK